MKFTLALAALVGLVAASPAPQGVSASLAPSSTAAPVANGCQSTYNGGNQFQIGIVNVSSTVSKRQATPDTEPGHSLYLSLSDGTLKDQGGNIGYIAANGQLQFDPKVPQTGAQITTGWSACPNNTLALASTIFYECLSGSFYNLYDKSLGMQCYPVNLDIIGSGVSAVSSAGSATATASATAVASATSAASATVYTSAASSAMVSSVMASSAPMASATAVAPAPVASSNATTSLVPFNPNAAPAVAVSGASAAVLAAAVGLGVFLL